MTAGGEVQQVQRPALVEGDMLAFEDGTDHAVRLVETHVPDRGHALMVP